MHPRAHDSIDRHLDAVWRLARVLADDAAEAEDLVQETYVRAMQALDDPATAVRHPAAERTWLLRITTNLHRDDLRRRRTRRRHAPHLAAAETDPRPGPSRLVGASELEQQAADAMAALPARQREVLHLAAVEQLDHASIGEVLGLSPTNVRTALQRARDGIRVALAPTASPPARTTGAAP
ncbi:MAG: RNA polymerase sigma factor [Phycisphaerales bacterium]